MRAGPMRNRVTFQSPTVNLNPFQAASAGSWTNVATVWAKITAVNPSNPLYQNLAQTMQVSHVITIRYPGSAFHIGSGWQAVMQTSAGQRVFQIQKGIVNVDERNRQLDIYAWETNPTAGGIPV